MHLGELVADCLLFWYQIPLWVWVPVQQEMCPQSRLSVPRLELESPCLIASSIFTFIGISPGSYISPRPGFRLFLQSLKERVSSSGGTLASRFKLLLLSSSLAGVGSDEDHDCTGAWGGIITCHSPATPCDRRSSSWAAIHSASESTYPSDWAVL